MKLTREYLKGIVKECLVEILSEGLSTTSLVGESKKIQRVQQKPQQRKNTALVETVQRIAGKDNVLKDILADTAATTLQTMLSHDSQSDMNNLKTGRPIQHNSNDDQVPDQFIEEAGSHWANLAFSEPANKKIA